MIVAGLVYVEHRLVSSNKPTRYGSGFLESEPGAAEREAVCLKILSGLMHKQLERQLADGKLHRLIVTPDRTSCCLVGAVVFASPATVMGTNGKRKQFGTRYLVDESAVFTYNAWDHVKWNDAQLAEAKAKKNACVDEREAKRLKENASAQWDAFYSRHDKKFFMDRNWLLTEFPELNTAQGRNEPLRVLEVGCGVGNTTIPLLNSFPRGQMFIYSCDYSPTAIKLLTQNEKFDTAMCHAFVWDICEQPTDQVPCGSLDVVLCIYVLSAIPPEKQQKAVDNLTKLLKPGGILLLKDYGEFDLTQLRFKKNRLIDGRLYCRGDGTLVYFFSQEELDSLLKNAGLMKEVNAIDHRLIVNRAKMIKMYRVWIQCKYVKPL